jgi:hypothetical protein
MDTEAANSLEVIDALLGPDTASSVRPDELQSSEIETELRQISADLDSRWRGALFALDVRNPGAARHFCTSARELFDQTLEVRAPDPSVLVSISDCSRTRDGKPTRRSKIEFILRHKGLATAELDDFVEADIKNIVDLFQVFNGATHGAAGKYGLGKLLLIKERVEGGIRFLARLC